MSSPAKYEVDLEELKLDVEPGKVRTPSPPQEPSPPKPKDRRAKAKFNIFSRVLFL